VRVYPFSHRDTKPESTFAIRDHFTRARRKILCTAYQAAANAFIYQSEASAVDLVIICKSCCRFPKSQPQGVIELGGFSDILKQGLLK